MSLATQEFECPECGEKQSIEVWHVINATLDPQAKDDLFEGKINMIRCSKCSHEVLLTIPVLYHDMEKEFMVQLIPPPLLEDEEFLSHFDRRGEIKPTNDLELGDMKKHLVFDYNELLRYITFRDLLFKKHSKDGSRIRKS